jgi:hypothetical protein
MCYEQYCFEQTDHQQFGQNLPLDLIEGLPATADNINASLLI